MKVSTGQSLHHRCGSGPFPALGILAPMFEPVNEGQLEPTSIPKLPFRNVGYPTITRRAARAPEVDTQERRVRFTPSFPYEDSL